MNKLREKIKHVIIVCMENRSYNHIFGNYEHDLPDSQLINDPTKNIEVATPHSFLGGLVCRSIKTHEGQLSTAGFKLSSSVTDVSAGKVFDKKYYDILTQSFKKGSLPTLHHLYENYVVCSRWFHSIPGPTYPNKVMLYSGNTKGKYTNEQILSNIDDNDQQTLLTLLDDNNKKYRVYYGESSDFQIFKAHKNPQKTIDGKFRDITQFTTDVKNTKPDDFPDVCVIEANYGTNWNYLENDYHPSGSLAISGEQFIANVYNTLIGNKQLWENSLLIVTFDEWGGFYDPIPPISVEPPQKPIDSVFDFKTSGFRVPTLLISPYTPHKVDNREYDHTSMLKFMIELYQLTNVNMGKRINSINMIDLNDFQLNSSNLTPQKITFPTKVYPLPPDIFPFDEKETHNLIKNFSEIFSVIMVD